MWDVPKSGEKMNEHEALKLDEDCGDYVHSNDPTECEARRVLAARVKHYREVIPEIAAAECPRCRNDGYAFKQGDGLYYHTLGDGLPSICVSSRCWEKAESALVGGE
jgi:hypothetical protein